MPECKDAFQSLKQLYRRSRLWPNPFQVNHSFRYVSVCEVATGAVLVREEESKQSPVYFVSKFFNATKLKYIEIEKYLYALVIIARKLRPYFHAHSITFLTNKSLKHFLMKPNFSGRIIKLSIKLSELAIKFAPKIAIKCHCLSRPRIKIQFTKFATLPNRWNLESMSGKKLMKVSEDDLPRSQPLLHVDCPVIKQWSHV